MRRLFFIIALLPMMISNGIGQPTRSLTFGLGSNFTSKHPLVSTHYSHSLYKNKLYITGRCAFLNVGIEEPTYTTTPDGVFSRPFYPTYEPNAHQYFISQISIGLQYGSTLFFHPRCSYNFLAGNSSYKSSLSTNSNSMYWVRFIKNRWRFYFEKKLASLRRRAGTKNEPDAK